MTDDREPRRRSADVDIAILQDQMRAALRGIDGIIVRLDKQNGRVGKLESWKAWMTGALAALGVVLAVALPIALYLLAQRANP